MLALRLLRQAKGYNKQQTTRRRKEARPGSGRVCYGPGLCPGWRHVGFARHALSVREAFVRPPAPARGVGPPGPTRTHGGHLMRPSDQDGVYALQTLYSPFSSLRYSNTTVRNCNRHKEGRSRKGRVCGQ